MKCLQINPADNVAVAISALQAGEVLRVAGKALTVLENIPAGNKVALSDISHGDNVVKYGFPIGHAVSDIKSGSLVNDLNIKTNLSGLLDYKYSPVQCVLADAALRLPARSFMGYKRPGGGVGIRNEIWIVPTVGCVSGVADELACRLREETRCDGIDAVVSFPHSYGCSQLGDDHENTRKILRDIILHPNAGAVLVVGLGCENNQPAALREMLGDYDHERIRFLVAQETQDEISDGMNMLREMYRIARCDVRTELPLHELKIGLKCGGSDGLSGITANPLLGVFSDYIVAHGGTSVLTEVPEMFGAETLLMNRCKDEETFRKTVRLINDFKQFFIHNGQPIYENPSPGNKAGGISTLEEKSLGCTQKAGGGQVQDVLAYGGRLVSRGLNLLSAPGSDVVAATALAAAGCHMVLFSTGRGTPFGTLVPTVKVSTNSALSRNKPRWIDFNAGSLVEGEAMESVAERFVSYVLAVASGESVANERNGYRDIAIFKTGVTL